MRLLFAVFVLAFSGTSYCAPISSIRLPDGWDSFRVGLGFADSDNYADLQIIVVRLTESGADLSVDRYGKKRITRSIDKRELTTIIDKLSELFAGATRTWRPYPDRPFPQHALILSIDRDLTRETFYRDISNQKEIINQYMVLVDKLAEPEQKE